MLIGGNRSTGIRTSATVPTMAIIRQATIIKNGYLIENPDITLPSLPRQPFPQLRAARDLLPGTRYGSQSRLGRLSSIRKQSRLARYLPTLASRVSLQSRSANSMPAPLRRFRSATLLPAAPSVRSVSLARPASTPHTFQATVVRLCSQNRFLSPSSSSADPMPPRTAPLSPQNPCAALRLAPLLRLPIESAPPPIPELPVPSAISKLVPVSPLESPACSTKSPPLPAPLCRHTGSLSPQQTARRSAYIPPARCTVSDSPAPLPIAASHRRVPLLRSQLVLLLRGLSPVRHPLLAALQALLSRPQPASIFRTRHVPPCALTAPSVLRPVPFESVLVPRAPLRPLRKAAPPIPESPAPQASALPSRDRPHPHEWRVCISPLSRAHPRPLMF